jgi:hypothetical protein
VPFSPHSLMVNQRSIDLGEEFPKPQPFEPCAIFQKEYLSKWHLPLLHSCWFVELRGDKEQLYAIDIVQNELG